MANYEIIEALRLQDKHKITVVNEKNEHSSVTYHEVLQRALF